MNILHDLEEEYDPAAPYASGSDAESAEWDYQEYREYAKMLGCEIA